MKTLQVRLAVVMFGMGLAGIPLAPAAIMPSDFATSGGGLYAASGSGSQVIPDYPGPGAGYAISFADTGLSINNISVTLNLSGGFNGDLYAYVSHGSQIAVLLNQITGTAANGSGFNVTLVEGTANPIQTANGTAGGILAGTTFTANDDLAVFNNTDPNGAWTLFFADRSSGDNSMLTGFSLNITAVPEPVNVALVIFGVAVVGATVARRYFRSRPVPPLRELA